MDSRTLSRLGFASAVGISACCLSSCGGLVSIQGDGGPGGSVGSACGLAGAVATGSAGTTSGSNPLLIQVTDGGVPYTAVLPANETIPASGTLAMVGTPGPLLSGLSLASGPPPSGHPLRPSTIAQGSVYVDGTNTGLVIGSNGLLSQHLALVPGNHVFTAYGPFVLTGKTTQLNISSFISFGVTVTADGLASLPLQSTFTLPPNGGSWTGCLISGVYLPPDFTTGTAVLNIVISSTASIAQTNPISSGSVLFSNLASGTTDQVPAGGLESISLNVTQ